MDLIKQSHFFSRKVQLLNVVNVNASPWPMKHHQDGHNLITGDSVNSRSGEECEYNIACLTLINKKPLHAYHLS